MDKALDMSLDDIIKSKKSAGRGKGRGGAPRGRAARGAVSGGRMRGIGRGAGRQGPLGVNTRPSSFAIAKSFRRTKNFPWQQDLFEDSLAAAGLPAMENGTKLHITNLDRAVSNDDIRELFSEIGELKRYAIHFDKNGQPSGSAEVVYAKRSDAFAAHKRYNNVQLDGRPMRIEVASPNSGGPVSARVNIVGGTNGKASRRVMTQRGGRTASSAQTNRGFGQQRTRGGFRNGPARAQAQTRGAGRGQSRGRGRGRGKKHLDKSAEDLDKELETYHAEGMQIS
ncbi:THO complex subunit 4D-like [Chenopodium quinoa]|uniref:THO complex subunit 4D-like n=1 Tax=Chenopodium quinoa TaxID=63459 RepID=UPI000B78F739|nr:THO complex subunit 4D-like [Chenopodium quinoa]